MMELMCLSHAFPLCRTLLLWGVSASHLCEWLGSPPRNISYHPNELASKEKTQQIGKEFYLRLCKKEYSLNIHILIMNVWDQQNPSQKYSLDVDIRRRKLWTVNQQKGKGLVVIFSLLSRLKPSNRGEKKNEMRTYFLGKRKLKQSFHRKW